MRYQFSWSLAAEGDNGVKVRQAGAAATGPRVVRLPLCWPRSSCSLPALQGVYAVLNYHGRDQSCLMLNTVRVVSIGEDQGPILALRDYYEQRLSEGGHNLGHL